MNAIQESPRSLRGRIDGLVDDRASAGVFRVHRNAFADPDVFRHEMSAVFENNWVFVGLASQLARPHDFITTRIGRQPVLLTRDGDGRLHAFLNSCRHRGMEVGVQRSGNRKTHVCRYHGWVYGSDGANQFVTHQDEGRYPSWFASQDHGLVPLARFDEYRGFLFASLTGDVPPLDEHLGDARVFLDLIVDQSPRGMEFVPGSGSYTFDANWKLQIENSIDMYHFGSTHSSYVEILAKRPADAYAGGLPPIDAAPVTQGVFSFGRGHAVTWRESRASPELLARRRAAYSPALDATRAHWASMAKNLSIFPNLQIVDNVTSIMLRVIHPLAVNRTEMRTHCMAPIGEDADLRSARIRDYEDFFNASGLATPDDNVAYELCQAGFGAQAAGWTAGYLRGLNANGAPSPAPYLDELALRQTDGTVGPRSTGDETCFHDSYREWHRLMLRTLPA